MLFFSKDQPDVLVAGKDAFDALKDKFPPV